MPDSLFNEFTVCPLTGLPSKGRASFSPYEGNNSLVLFQFVPIGRAVFEFNFLVGLYHSAAAGTLSPSAKLAGLCRQASEKGQEPVHITSKLFHDAQGTSETLDEKRDHLLRVLLEVDIPAYKTRDIDIHQDFPLAFAQNGAELHLILEECIRRGLLDFQKPFDTPNDWPDGRRTHYFGVHLTRAGEKAAADSILPPQLTTSTMTSEDIVRRQAQVAFSRAQAQRFAFNSPDGLVKTRTVLIAGTEQFYDKSDKKIYLEEVLNLLDTALAKHKPGCEFRGKSEPCPIELGMQETIHFVQQEVKKLGKVEVAFPFQTNHIFNFSGGSTNTVATGANAMQTTNTGQGALLNVARGNTITQSGGAGDVQQMKELVEQLKQVLAGESFARQREDIDDQLQMVEAQLQRPEPRKSILERSVKSLQELAAEGLGSVGGHAAFEILKQLAEQVSSLG
ncbi:hypothetical protein [Hymenobacter swuensis]|uniref:Uncharacterized protein n=1 Tax=Hymenobacter swuensis DY53 TaxID=1227739 RepID=W8EYZ5_9BACT|nr:hypothetical protein [Hymenobacter swuensis]AHJ95561.1 hypothetical protein Hsw_PA0228 [Hymenobacter swuensis DY53]